MDDLLGVILTSGVSGLTSAGILLALFAAYLRNMTSRMALLESEIDRLETERVKKIETRLEAHLATDRSQEIITQLNLLTKSVDILTVKLDKALAQSAEQSAQIVAAQKYIENLDKSQQRHEERYHNGNRS